MFRPVLLAVTLLLFNISSHPAAAAAAAMDFQQWCQLTTHPSLCIDVIQSDSRSNLKTTPGGLCQILADKAISAGTATAFKIDNLLRGSTGDITGSLRVCYEVFQNSVSNLKEISFNVVNHQTYFQQRSGVHIALGQEDDCADAFSRIHVQSPVASENSYYRNVALTILEILNINECNRLPDCPIYKEM